MSGRLRCGNCGRRLAGIPMIQTWLCRAITAILGPDDAVTYWRSRQP